MNKASKILSLTLGIVFFIIQFIPVEKPLSSDDDRNDLIRIESIPEDVAGLLQDGCYDCHSERPKYPWYGSIAPVSWLVIRDVRLGREELNFSQWGQLNKRKKIRALTSITEEVEGKAMPLPIYKIMHSEARFNEAERALIISWADALSSSILED